MSRHWLRRPNFVTIYRNAVNWAAYCPPDDCNYAKKARLTFMTLCVPLLPAHKRAIKGPIRPNLYSGAHATIFSTVPTLGYQRLNSKIVFACQCLLFVGNEHVLVFLQ